MRTQKAVKACAAWLRYCLSLGWAKDDLDAMETLWWQYHDDYGELIRKHPKVRKLAAATRTE